MNKLVTLIALGLALGLAWAEPLPKLTFWEAAQLAQRHLKAATPPEEISLSWKKGRPVYGVDLARGAYLVQVYVDGQSGNILGLKPLKERALGARAWLKGPPALPLAEAIARAQKALGTQKPPAEVAYQIVGGRPTLLVDLSQQVVLDAQTGQVLAVRPLGQ
ncbi:hypothetical protein [Thermus scotoductus]|uniref:PepSY domain-containing protein n=1 Tax=Thermus scotoductus TaxID=37636 RepID=A0A430QZN1_THESC|nr:hypothetical protein [Thermus scotoductus]RTG92399.1 hypothetical protein CSW49_12770 [Thermus scotoductus]RTH00612.1 hypothetical protein CSW45_13000 [Thermus scotoductus]RTH15636.1 hypothetical protein CSW42_14525 [Thermus scotoductus]RTI03354.1 hypothetical protein CSW28_00125 [Thermus scotoductus]RTI22111.1 hypothetical protein CSW21_06220 [Thermus scotoductus]